MNDPFTEERPPTLAELQAAFREVLEPIRAQLREIEGLIDEKKAELAGLYELRRQAERTLAYANGDRPVAKKNGRAAPPPRSRGKRLDELTEWFRAHHGAGDDITVMGLWRANPLGWAKDSYRRAVLELADLGVLRLDRTESVRGGQRQIFRLTAAPEG